MWSLLAVLWNNLCDYASGITAAAVDPLKDDGGSIALLNGAVPTDPGTVWGDLTEVSYTGYARVPSTWLTTGIDGSGNVSVYAAPALFVNGGSTPVVVTGVAMVDEVSGTPTNTWMVFPLPTPVTIPPAGVLQVVYSFPRGANAVVI